MVDPATTRVRGQVRRGGQPKGAPLADMLSEGGRPLQRLVEAAGEEPLSKCLSDLGLIGG